MRPSLELRLGIDSSGLHSGSNFGHVQFLRSSSHWPPVHRRDEKRISTARWHIPATIHDPPVFFLHGLTKGLEQRHLELILNIPNGNFEIIKYRLLHRLPNNWLILLATTTRTSSSIGWSIATQRCVYEHIYRLAKLIGVIEARCI